VCNQNLCTFKVSDLVVPGLIACNLRLFAYNLFGLLIASREDFCVVIRMQGQAPMLSKRGSPVHPLSPGPCSTSSGFWLLLWCSKLAAGSISNSHSLCVHGRLECNLKATEGSCELGL